MKKLMQGLASERIQVAPLRYYVWLPTLHIADMWLRPRAELLPPDPRGGGSSPMICSG